MKTEYTEEDVNKVYELTMKANDMELKTWDELHDYMDQFTEAQQWEIAKKVAQKIRLPK